MIPWFKKLLFDETAGLRAFRALMVGAGIFAVQAEGLPSWAKALGAALAGMGTFIGAGEKNPKGQQPR